MRRAAGRSAGFALARRLLIGCGAAVCLSADARADDASRDASQDVSKFVRSGTRDGLTSFETGTRVYRPKAADGTSVSLVGVVHIGDKSYYERIVALLETHDLVLFESVLPRGAFGTGGHGDLARQRSTQDAMIFLRKLIADYAVAKGALPESISELRAFVVGRDTRLARPLDLACVDGWSRPLAYARDGAGLGFRLASLGADGAAGGRGLDLDLVLRSLPTAAAEKVGKPDDTKEAQRDLYGDLAAALETSLQVRSIDYDRSNWIPADLPMEELLDRLWKRGERSMTLEMLSSQDGLGQGLVRFLLSIVSKSPGFKKMVIEALGSAGDSAGRRGRSGLGAVDERIILDERNDAVIDKLREVLAAPKPPKSVAIFYGAAHMGDFERTLRSEFALEPSESFWFRAMSVDEWNAKRIEARIKKLEEERDALVVGDPAGNAPASDVINRRIGELRERLGSRE
jgi:Type II secretion system (T2SS), protein G